jgi:LacI family transcriptional regulator
MGRKPQELSIYKIAKDTGFSIATVSRVLHKRPGVSEKVRRIVEAAMEKVRFTPNYPQPQFRNMALVIPFEVIREGGTEYISRLICSVSLYSEEKAINTCLVFQRANEKNTLLEKLRRQQACGALFVLGGLIREQIAELEGCALPLISLDGKLDLDFTGYVDNSAKDGIEETVEHLHGLGHTRIAFLYNLPQLSNHADRRECYANAMKRRGLDVLLGEFADDGDYASVTSAVTRLAKEKATAIMTVNDDTALFVLRACRENAISVPGEMSVVGFDNNPNAKHYIPPLTTVHHPTEDICREAVLNMHRLASRDGERTLPKIELKTRLIIRESTGPCQTADAKAKLPLRPSSRK